MSKISVIVPVYKTEQYLADCVDSILNQTYQNLEVILVDDGSPDNCPAICDRFAEKDSRVRVIHKPNGGTSSARNAGINAATGDWIMFVDSDDFCDPNLCQYMIEAACQCSVPLVISTGYYYSTKRKKRISSPKENRLIVTDSSRMVNEWLWTSTENTILFTIVWSKLYKRDFFKETLLFEEGIYHEDEEFSTRLYLTKYDIAFLDEPLYYYRANENSMTYRRFSEEKCLTLKCLYDRCMKYTEKGWTIPAKKAAKNFCEVYLEYGQQALEVDHFEWVSKYHDEFTCMRRFIGMRGHLKDQLRYRIFEISPTVYKRLLLKE